jgi:hypothetical protein
VRRINLALGLLVLCLTAFYFGEISRRLRLWLTGNVEIDGLTYYLADDGNALTETILDSGTWEPTQTSVIRNQLCEGDTFIDIGANIGWYTVLASKRVGENGRVIAFEPDPGCFALLKRNVEENGCQNVILEQKALSDKSGTIEFGGTQVQAVRLDDYLNDFEGHVDVVKSDTEGFEGVIFDGMRETIRRYRNVKLVLEYHPTLLQQAGYDPRQLLRGIESAGFEIGVIDESTDSIIKATTTQLARLQGLLEQEGAFINILLSRPDAELKDESAQQSVDRVDP